MQSEYMQSVRKLFKEVRKITKLNIDRARKRQQRGNKTAEMVPVHTMRDFFMQTKGVETGSKVDRTFEVVCRLGVDYKIKSKEDKITVVHHDHFKHGYPPLNDGGYPPLKLFVLLKNLEATMWFTLFPLMMFNLIAIMLQISHVLGLGILGKIFICLIGTVLLRNTLRAYTVVINNLLKFCKPILDANLL